MAYTYRQSLLVNKKTGEYAVKEPDQQTPYGWRWIGNLGKLASQMRTIGEKKFWAKLPNIPNDIRDSINAIAEHQANWSPGDDEPEMTEEEKAIDAIGRW